MNINRNAYVSQCGHYRYWLTRSWDVSRPQCAFIMLNPSTADHEVDDPTIKKCIGFADRMGFGGLTVLNVFAYRATKPAAMRLAAKNGVNIVGDDNLFWIAKRIRGHERVICAWGANARGMQEPSMVLNILRNAGVRSLHALRLLADGTPEHPLMLPYDCADALVTL